MKNITWKSSKGNTLELLASATVTLSPEMINLDGDIIKTSNVKTSTDRLLIFKMDGKEIARTTRDWAIKKVNNDIKKFEYLEKLAFTNEQAEIIEAFLKGIIEEAKTELVKEAEEVKETIEKATKVKEAKRVIFEANNTKKIDGRLMTSKEAMEYRKGYNNLHNEGGEGFVPSVITQNEYDKAVAILN